MDKENAIKALAIKIREIEKLVEEAKIMAEPLDPWEDIPESTLYWLPSDLRNCS